MMPSHFAPHDHDFDGRPPCDDDNYDPLLVALCRAHPEMIPPELAALRGRDPSSRGLVRAGGLSLS